MKLMTEPSKSLLSEISPQSLALVMNKPGSEITDQDAEVITDYLRRLRTSVRAEEKTGRKVQADPNMTLEDLGL